MFESILSQFLLDVIPAYKEYISINNNAILDNGADIRKGLEASVSLYHFGEHYAQCLNQDFKKVVKPRLVNLCTDYSLLGNVADVRKHRFLDRQNPKFLSANSMIEKYIITKYNDESGEYQDTEKSIEITLIDGVKRQLMDVLTNVMNMWYAELYNENIIKKIEYHSNYVYGVRQKKNRNAVKDVELHQTSGLGLNMQMVFQVYDNNTSKIVPLTTGERMLRFGYIDNDTGLHAETDLPFIETEYIELQQLGSEQERLEYSRKIAKKKGVTDRLMLQLNAAKINRKNI
ncbi:hypothetical protein [Spirosoma endophyticum]|uniref:Uncharacterized protein n=1 Tax=Spirosoma endophyticum TaxID=662367 RepID=A0A1I1UTX7_9BACT|nr:hypothetical protein [Spirosoma endophyticum]SFD72323.1 hypothetical protein SAMN05216167_106337 [Spirosoma endophyticum]